MTPMLIISICSLAAWLAILALPWKPWRVGEVLEDLPDYKNGSANRDLSEITVLIPARNEAALIGETLGALREQGDGLKVLLVDDCSTDGTVQAAESVPGIDLEIVRGDPLPEGWRGKPWALEQGLRRIERPCILLLDADIRLKPGVICRLQQASRQMERPFLSVMAELPMRNFWEKLLSPAFIYFFKMLYPFSLANGPDRRSASAAGGCILVRRALLETIGGFAAIRGALIDDCALALKIKQAGFRTWTGQSRQVISRRGYSNLADFWAMVSRSAYTQLNYSIALLALSSLSLSLLFLAPVFALLSPAGLVRLCGALAIAAMAASLLPTLRFYQLNPLWAFSMPLTGLLYLLMTWSSAINYYRGKHATWKGRDYLSSSG